MWQSAAKKQQETRPGHDPPNPALSDIAAPRQRARWAHGQASANLQGVARADLLDPRGYQVVVLPSFEETGVWLSGGGGGKSAGRARAWIAVDNTDELTGDHTSELIIDRVHQQSGEGRESEVELGAAELVHGGAMWMNSWAAGQDTAWWRALCHCHCQCLWYRCVAPNRRDQRARCNEFWPSVSRWSAR